MEHKKTPSGGSNVRLMPRKIPFGEDPKKPTINLAAAEPGTVYIVLGGSLRVEREIHTPDGAEWICLGTYEQGDFIIPSNDEARTRYSVDLPGEVLELSHERFVEYSMRPEALRAALKSSMRGNSRLRDMLAESVGRTKRLEARKSELTRLLSQVDARLAQQEKDMNALHRRIEDLEAENEAEVQRHLETGINRDAFRANEAAALERARKAELRAVNAEGHYQTQSELAAQYKERLDQSVAELQSMRQRSEEVEPQLIALAHDLATERRKSDERLTMFMNLVNGVLRRRGSAGIADNDLQRIHAKIDEQLSLKYDAIPVDLSELVVAEEYERGGTLLPPEPPAAMHGMTTKTIGMFVDQNALRQAAERAAQQQLPDAPYLDEDDEDVIPTARLRTLRQADVPTPQTAAYERFEPPAPSKKR